MEIAYSLVHHPLVIGEDFPRLDPAVRREIRDAVRSKLLVHPELFGKPLRRSLKGHRTLRIGDYRVVYRIEARIIKLVGVFHRSYGYECIERRV